MIESFQGAFLIMGLRILDVSLGTFRTLMVVQGKKLYAASLGFFEVLIWIYAMKYIVNHLDNEFNMIGYALGFALGNFLGITLEQKFAIGFAQLNIISKHHTDDIANKLRLSKFGVTIIPAEGGTGGMAILVIIIRRKDLPSVQKIIEEIDSECFISIQHSRPYRGFIHGVRK